MELISLYKLITLYPTTFLGGINDYGKLPNLGTLSEEGNTMGY